MCRMSQRDPAELRRSAPDCLHNGVFESRPQGPPPPRDWDELVRNSGEKAASDHASQRRDICRTNCDCFLKVYTLGDRCPSQSGTLHPHGSSEASSQGRHSHGSPIIPGDGGCRCRRNSRDTGCTRRRWKRPSCSCTALAWWLVLEQVATTLRSRGHTVFTPTQTRLGRARAFCCRNRHARHVRRGRRQCVEIPRT